MAEQLLELPSGSLFEAGSVAAESLVGIGIYGYGLLMSIIGWILTSSVRVAEIFQVIFESGLRIVFAFVSVVTPLLETSLTMVQVVWDGLIIVSSITWNGFIIGVDMIWSGFMLLPGSAWPMWNLFVTGSSIMWEALVIGGGAMLKSLSLIGIIFWNSLKFVVVGSWTVLTVSLHMLLTSFNVLAYVTYELGFLIARVLHTGLRAAFVFTSALVRFGSNKCASLFHLQSWTAIVQYVYKYFHAVYTSFKLNVKFITSLPSLVFPENLMLWTSVVILLLTTAVLYVKIKSSRRRKREQTEMMHNRHQNAATEHRDLLHRDSLQRRAATVSQPPPDALANNEINRRKNSGSISSRRSSRGSESTDVNDELQQRLRELELRLDHEKEQQMCVVCLDSERMWMLKPCNHYCVCEQCVHHLNNKCPICRKVIRAKEKVFHV